MPLSAAVLGCGPAGLLAAHAARRVGYDVNIYSRKEKSIMPGAQYLHEEIPGIPDWRPDGYLRYVKLGRRDRYAKKVYGDRRASCSWDKFQERSFPAWSMSRAYDWLWASFSEYIRDTEVTDCMLDYLVRNYHIVISAIPRPILCVDPDHQWDRQPVWIAQGEYAEVVEPNTIVYSGRLRDPWYRSSLIFGYGSTEYGVGRYAPEGSWNGAKPISTTCRCRPEIIKVGRFGEWRKDVLINHAFHKAHSALEERAR